MIECPTCGCNNTEQAQRCEKCASPLSGSDLRCGLYTYGGTSNGQVLQMRYIITRELSSDFTGVKYLAEDAEEKKDVIIWALPTIVAADEDKIKSLSELCDSLNKLTDEHILNVSGVYSKRNARYIVVEYFDGCSLEEKVASEGPLNLEQVLEIFSPIAKSLDLAHKQGFIHGDICPANVLINSKGVIKLAYFAIGKEIKEMLSRISPEGKTEPSLYTAPEQLGNAACSAQSDIYSLASCIHQSLCEEPFRRQSQELEQEPGQLPQLSEKQNKVLLRSLSVNPQDRHSSAVELLTELRDSATEKELTEPEQISYEKSLADLKQKAQEQNRENEEAIKKLIADAEKEKQQHSEILSQAQTQAREQAEQQRADYEERTEQLKAKIAETEAELTAVVSEANRKTEALAAEKEKALQRSREREETIKKLTADAEKEKQQHAEILRQARTQAREQAEQQQADYEERTEQLKAKIAETEAKLAAALSETGALAAERERLLQQSREHEGALEEVGAEAKRKQQKSAKQLNQAQWESEAQAEEIKQIKIEAAKTASRFKTKLKFFALISIAILCIVTGYLYIQQNENPFKQLIASRSSQKQGVYETSIVTDSIVESGVVKQRQTENEMERTVPEQTFSELTEEAAGLEVNNQQEKAIELPAEALSYNDNAEVSEELEAANEKQRTLAQIKQIAIELQGWLESATDFE